MKSSKSNLVKILYVGNFLSGSGLSCQPCEELVPRLQERNWHITTTSKIKNRVGRLIAMLWTIWTKRRSYDVAVVDLFSGPAFIWAELVSTVLKAFNKRLILVMHGGGLPDFTMQQPRRVSNLLAKADHVLAPSTFLKEKMAPFARDIELVLNGIELSDYQANQFTNVAPKLIWLRAFARIYNPILAVETISCLKVNFPQISLTMIGPDIDGSLGEVKSKAEILGLRESLSLSGKVPKQEVPKRLALGDIFLNTTNVDNTPVSVIEAMACGLCVVSTNVGGLPYLLEDGVDALLVPPNDAGAMAEAVRRILTEPDLAAHLSCNARSKAEQFDWEVVLPQWEKLLVGFNVRR